MRDWPCFFSVICDWQKLISVIFDHHGYYDYYDTDFTVWFPVIVIEQVAKCIPRDSVMIFPNILFSVILGFNFLLFVIG